jgi:hypothetical protein
MKLMPAEKRSPGFKYCTNIFVNMGQFKALVSNVIDTHLAYRRLYLEVARRPLPLTFSGLAFLEIF